MKRLLESGARPFGTSKGTLTSVLLHGGLIAAAVMLTGREVIPPREKVEEHPVLYVATPAPKPAAEPLPAVERPRTPERKAAPAPRRRAEPPRPTPRPTPRPAAPRPAPRPPAQAPMPTQVPTTIPDPVPNAAEVAAAAAQAAADEAAAREAAAREAAAAEAARAAAAAEADRLAAAARAEAADRAGGGRVETESKGDVDPSATFNANQVERAVQMIRAAEPRYPESLRSVNVQGEVVLRYIVGTNGRVESGSIEVVSSPHKLFSEAARTALLNTRFRPAEVGGRAVRQLAEQTFTFRLQ